MTNDNVFTLNGIYVNADWPRLPHRIRPPGRFIHAALLNPKQLVELLNAAYEYGKAVGEMK